MEDAFGCAVVAQKDVAVVVEPAAGDEGGEVGAEAVDAQAGDVFGEVFCVCADVAHAAGSTGAGGVGAPGGLFLAGVFKWCGKPALGVFDEDFADGAKFTGANDVAGLFDEGVAGVVVGEEEGQAGLADGVVNVLCVLKGVGEGFVAGDGEAGAQGGDGRPGMEVVGCDDCDEVDAFFRGECGLFFDHFLPGGVGAVGRQAEVEGGKVAGFMGVGGEGAAVECDFAIEGRSHTVDGADEGVGAAADHAHADGAVGGGVLHGVVLGIFAVVWQGGMVFCFRRRRAGLVLRLYGCGGRLFA